MKKDLDDWMGGREEEERGFVRGDEICCKRRVFVVRVALAMAATGGSITVVWGWVGGWQRETGRRSGAYLYPTEEEVENWDTLVHFSSIRDRERVGWLVAIISCRMHDSGAGRQAGRRADTQELPEE